MDAQTTYYRTAKGNKRHASAFCANSRRRKGGADIVKLTAERAAEMAPCKFCCKGEEQIEAPKPTTCRNSGVKNVRKVYSHCVDCGKGGTVNRNTGTLRAHKPLSA